MSGDPEGEDAEDVAGGQPVAGGRPSEPEASRPLVERFGLAAIAVLLAVVFAFVALAAWTSGEIFLAVMAGIGALMTIWAATSTLRRD